MKKIILIILSILTGGSGYSKEIALSFDDAPRAFTALIPGSDRPGLLVEALKESRVSQVVFFCNTSRFDDAGKARIKMYSDNGHLIANHSDSHPDLNSLEPEKFWENVMLADKTLKQDAHFRRWLRFPFLHEGKTKEVRDNIREKMKSAEYRNGYVTVDTTDWYVDSLVQKKISEGYSVDRKKLGAAYVLMMMDTVEFFDRLAVKVLKRSPKHVILLHENDIAALYVKDLIAALRAKKWKIISPDEAYKDAIAADEPDTLINNQGRISAIARANGFKDSIWPKWDEETKVENYLNEQKVFKK
jgi:peptidoglycan/xylan/chitin deacetylase (PgdA/CDA1 family)